MEPGSCSSNNEDQQGNRLLKSTTGDDNCADTSAVSTKKSPCKLVQLKLLRKPPINNVPKKFDGHKCSSACLDEDNRLKTIKGVKILDHCVLINRVNPYCVPIFLAWQRTKVDRFIVYRSPCGKQLDSIRKVYNYLVRNQSKLSIDQFSFHSQLKLFTHREPFKAYSYIQDITNGQENVAVPCINELDESTPVDEFVYTALRIPGPDVNLTFDKEFMASCQCSDNCLRKESCECHSLSSEEAFMIAGRDFMHLAGYTFKHINKNIVPAIFECNSNCKCSSRCLNRVVQNGIKHCFQVYKTPDKGWALRCLHDIPPGAFVCLYSGEVINFATVNEESRGNEYIAALDYIDGGKRCKRDFDLDSDVDSLLDNTNSSSSSMDISSSESYSTDSFYGDLEDNEPEGDEIRKERARSQLKDNDNTNEPPLCPGSSNGIVTSSDDPLTKAQSKRNLDESQSSPIICDIAKKRKNNDSFENIEQVDDELINEILSSQRDLERTGELMDFNNKLEIDEEESSKVPSQEKQDLTTFDNTPTKTTPSKGSSDLPLIMRHLDEQHSYSVDGKRFGNIGRFLNHSCEPNCRIRNILVDTQDYRFPWLAFFSTRLIRAYEELTWDYHYPPDIPYSHSKPCFCGSKLCRGRIY